MKFHTNKCKFAIESGNLELVRLLLDNGPSVNRTFGMHQTYVFCLIEWLPASSHPTLEVH